MLLYINLAINGRCTKYILYIIAKLIYGNNHVHFESDNKPNGGGSCAGRDNNLFNKIQDILIIHKFNITPINLLFCVFFLFHLENVLKVAKRES